MTIVDAAKVEGQVAMFDRLLVHDETPKIVDVWHRSYGRFIETMGQIGFMDEARRAMVQPIVLFHVGRATSASLACRLAGAGPRNGRN